MTERNGRKRVGKPYVTRKAFSQSLAWMAATSLYLASDLERPKTYLYLLCPASGLERPKNAPKKVKGECRRCAELVPEVLTRVLSVGRIQERTEVTNLTTALETANSNIEAMATRIKTLEQKLTETTSERKELQLRLDKALGDLTTQSHNHPSITTPTPASSRSRPPLQERCQPQNDIYMQQQLQNNTYIQHYNPYPQPMFHHHANDFSLHNSAYSMEEDYEVDMYNNASWTF
ncbi:hypothetical protein GGX14DRAFT_390076 [Mycena pura]|uniref:Uncharacterized protein n=1 Tax=Mycena pura TaxID=153505 RepID=A0AAD6VTZ0_9AGAR|nr:hypothetical protein GGX14DRAFT_390076 [Mycena pura]